MRPVDAALLLGVVLFASCGGQTDEETETTAVPAARAQIEAVGPLLVWSEGSGADWGADDQAIDAVLDVANAGTSCVFLDGDLTVWPEGTTWDETTSAVVPAGSAPLVAGARVDVAGGSYPFDQILERMDDGARSLAEECRSASAEVTVLNPDAELTSAG